MTRANADALVFFGVTGDLAYRKIFPALQAMVQDDVLNLPVIGVARAGWTLDRLRQRVRESLEDSNAQCASNARVIVEKPFGRDPDSMRAGKYLPVTATEVVVRLKPPPLAIFDTIDPAAANYFRFRLSPEVVISAGARVKRKGEPMAGEPVELVARHSATGASDRRTSAC